MIKIECTHVDGWVSAIRGMRNPMNSWEQSDSGYGCVDQLCENCSFDYNWCGNTGKYKIGEKDLRYHIGYVDPDERELFFKKKHF